MSDKSFDSHPHPSRAKGCAKCDKPGRNSLFPDDYVPNQKLPTTDEISRGREEQLKMIKRTMANLTEEVLAEQEFHTKQMRKQAQVKKDAYCQEVDSQLQQALYRLRANTEAKLAELKEDYDHAETMTIKQSQDMEQELQIQTLYDSLHAKQAEIEQSQRDLYLKIHRENKTHFTGLDRSHRFNPVSQYR